VIVGLGIDVVDVGRFEATLARSPALRERLFTAAERQHSPASLAARFAAKEALAKALGAPAGLHWVDAEVHREAVTAMLTAGRRKLSLVDCSSFVLMRRQGIDTVFTFDDHFPEQGFAAVPGWPFFSMCAKVQRTLPGASRCTH
jgi:phosphopantetheine--protein transferase-like protein